MARGEDVQRPESDVQADHAVAASRATGGVPDESEPDQHSTTGTTVNETFVGRVAGADPGYAGETGAERRAAASGKAVPDGAATEPAGDRRR
jgi:hypothetical protein